MSLGRMPRSRDALAMAAALGLHGRTFSSKPRPRFLPLASAEESPVREQPMKSEHSGGGNPERRVVKAPRERFKPYEDPLEHSIARRRAESRGEQLLPSVFSASVEQELIKRREPEAPRLLEEPVAPRSRQTLAFMEGAVAKRHEPLETVKQDVEKARGELTDATADYFAVVIVNPAFEAATKGWETQAFPETQAAEFIEGVSARLGEAVAAPLRSLGAAFGLSSGEATVAAGISTNIILAPITGPLDKAATFVEVAGIVVGVLTGAHGLVLACAKLLSHDQAKRALSHGIAELLGGSHATDTRKPVARSVPTRTDTTPDQICPAQGENRLHWPAPQPERRSADDFAGLRKLGTTPESQRGTEHGEQYWLCLCFVPKPSADLGEPDHSMATKPTRRPGRAPTAPLADNEFVNVLSLRLRPSRVSNVSAKRIREMGHMPEGQHFIARMGRIGAGTVNAKSGSQTIYRHPGCLTGQCAQAGRTLCVCPCVVCRRARKIALLGNRLRGSGNVLLPGRPISARRVVSGSIQG